MLRILSLLLSVIAFAGILILVMGYRAESEYKESIVFEVSYSPQFTWQELINIKSIPGRKEDVSSIDILEEYGKLIAWRENLKTGGYRKYRMNSVEENKKLILELTDSSYGLKGVWIFETDISSGGTMIKISEESTIEDIKVRGWRAIFGRDHDLLVWKKYITVGLSQSLLKAL